MRPFQQLLHAHQMLKVVTIMRIAADTEESRELVQEARTFHGCC
jgi:hypothetical protein